MANKTANRKNVEVVATATLKNVKYSARKTRLVVDMIRNQQVEPALNALEFSPKKRAKTVKKLLLSAVANAREKGADVDSLWIVGAYVDEAATMMRFKPRARGSAFPIRRRSSHITLELGTL